MQTIINVLRLETDALGHKSTVKDVPVMVLIVISPSTTLDFVCPIDGEMGCVDPD